MLTLEVDREVESLLVEPLEVDFVVFVDFVDLVDLVVFVVPVVLLPVVSSGSLCTPQTAPKINFDMTL